MKLFARVCLAFLLVAGPLAPAYSVSTLSTLGAGPGVEAYTFVNAEAATYVAAMGVQPNNARKAVIDTLIGSLKTAGVWTKLDVFYLFAAHDASAALINAKNPGTFDAALVNAPAFEVDRGYTGDGSTSYLSTGFTPSTAGGQFALNSAHLGVWSRTNAQHAGAAIGSRTSSSSNQSYIFIRSATNQLGARMNHSVGTGLNPSSTDSSGHIVVRRSASNAQAAFRNAASLGTAIETTTALSTAVIIIGAFNTGGVITGYNNYQFAAAHLGANLTDQNLTDFYNALQTYMTAVGA